MDAKIKALLEPKTKSPATLKSRAAYIFQLYRALGGDREDFSFLNDKKSVMAMVRNSDNVGTQKTRLFNISEFVKLLPESVMSKSVKEFYKKNADKMKQPAAELEDNNIMSQSQSEKHISIDSANLMLETALVKLFEKYNLPRTHVSAADFARLNTGKDRMNIYTFGKGLQELLLPACFVWQVALRNDWSDLTITRKVIGIPNTGNWLQILKNGKMNIILNEYKSAKHYGKVKFELTDKLTWLMSVWLDLLEKMLGHKPTKPLYYSVAASGKISLNKPETFARQLARVSKKIFNVEATINTFRHAHEMQIQNSEEYKRMTIKERKAIHAQLLHSLGTAEKYNLQRRDVNTESNDS